MQDSGVESFLPFLKKAYGSLEQPDYSFVEKKFKSNPYRGLVHNLSEYFAVDDVSSKMDDVCFRYVLRGRDSLWGLDLSLVGPFALFMRLSPAPSKLDVLTYDNPNLNAREKKVMDVLRSKKIILVDGEQLEKEISFHLLDQGGSSAAKLYQTLFSDSFTIPWKN